MGAHRDWPPLSIEPRVSRRMALFVGATHGLAMLAVATLPVGLYAVPLLLLLILSAAHAVYANVLMRAPWSVRAARWQADGTWTIRLGSGEELSLVLAPATFVSPPLVVLNFRVRRFRRHALPLFADALDPDLMRRLRQRLRIQGCETATDPLDAQPAGDKVRPVG